MEGISPVGWLSLVPPVLTIVLAIATRQVVVSLLVGIASAILILQPSPAASQAVLGEQFTWGAYFGTSASDFVTSLFEANLWESLFNEDHLRVFAFTSLLGMQVALIHRSGGMLGIVRWAEPFARSRRGGQLLTWCLGLIVFIDDYANTLLLGSTMRPVTDRLKISREKLAFLVDSTAAPVSGLALVSTWVATELSTMQTGYADAGIDIGNDTFGIFIQTIPTRFYILYALAFVFICGLLCRDFGPMLTAEQRAQTTPPTTKGNASYSGDGTPRAINAILPIVLTVMVVIWLLVLTGRAEAGVTDLPPLADWQAWGQIIGQGSSYLALVYGALTGLFAIVGLILWQRTLSSDDIRASMLDGFVHVLPALVILWLAWTLSNLTGEDNLRTGEFLAAKVGEWSLSPALMPTIVFVLASGIAFSTGTSWGTMLILMPIVIPLVFGLLTDQLGVAPPPDHFLLTASIGSVLAGAIFGDHCSPISDTTILSSRSSDCDHIAHVRTQMPYALTIGAVAVLVGTLPAGFGVSSWILIPLGIVSLVVVLLALGRPVEVNEAE